MTPVNEVTDVAKDAHLAARELLRRRRQPDGERVRLAGSPFRSDRGRGDARARHRCSAPTRRSLGRARRRGPPPPAAATATSILASRWPACASSTSRGPSPGRSPPGCWPTSAPTSIKLESEHRLDPIRHIGPQPTAVVSLDTNGVFQDCAAGKRAVTFNVDTPEGQDLARRLIATADVVTANYTPDRLDRWGFDRATLAALRPGLIVANLAVMGLAGPDAGWRSYGNGLVAMSGVAAHTGFEGRVPQCLGTMHTDFTVPYFAAMQILAALHHRDRTGEGCYLELSQYESSVRLMDVELADVLNGGAGPGRIANRSAWCDPHGVFPAAGDDRWVAIACRDDAERARAGRACIGDAADRPTTPWRRGPGRSTASRRSSPRCAAPGVPVSGVEDLGDHQPRPDDAGVGRRSTCRRA